MKWHGALQECTEASRGRFCKALKNLQGPGNHVGRNACWCLRITLYLDWTLYAEKRGVGLWWESGQPQDLHVKTPLGKRTLRVCNDGDPDVRACAACQVLRFAAAVTHLALAYWREMQLVSIQWMKDWQVLLGRGRKEIKTTTPWVVGDTICVKMHLHL